MIPELSGSDKSPGAPVKMQMHPHLPQEDAEVQEAQGHGICIPNPGSQVILFFFLKEFLYFYLFIYLFIYFWLCWVFISVRGLSPVAASGGHSSSRCMGLSLSWALLLRSTSSRRTGSVVVAHGPSCSAACGIFPGQGSNPCPLHWQADSQPLRHQGSPQVILKIDWVVEDRQVELYVPGRAASPCKGPGA